MYSSSTEGKAAGDSSPASSSSFQGGAVEESSAADGSGGQVSEAASLSRGRNLQQLGDWGLGASAGGEWPGPFLKEWLYEVVEGKGALAGIGGQGAGQRGSSIATCSTSSVEMVKGAGGGCVGRERVRHRMYVKLLPSEVRVATVITAGAR